SGVALAPRARDLVLLWRADVVARRARSLARRCQGALPLRGVRAGVAAGPASRAAPPPCVLLLQARAASLGPRAPRRPADSGADDGGRAGDRLLRRFRLLPRAVPVH